MPDDEFGDALNVLTHEIRVAVLREPVDTDGPVAFSEPRGQVGVRDPRKFNGAVARSPRPQGATQAEGRVAQ